MPIDSESTDGIFVHNMGVTECTPVAGKRPKPKVVELEYVEDIGMGSRLGFSRKVQALIDLIDQGLLFKTKPAKRLINTRAMKRSLIDKVLGQYWKRNPKFAQKLIDRINKNHYDHVWELQLGGADELSNLKLLNGITNWHVGTQQITRQLRNIDYGTPVIIKLKEK